MGNHSEVIGPEVVLPGSQQLAPVLFGLVAFVAAVALVIGLVVRRRRRARSDSVPRTPVVTGIMAVVLVAAVAAAWVTRPPAFFTPEFPPIGRLMPEDSMFHRPADDLPAHDRSDEWLAGLDAAPVRAAFGDEPQEGVVFGMPFNLVDDDTPRTDVRFRRPAPWRYTGEYPVTSPAYIESMPTYGIDNHYIALDRDAGRMWELIGTVVWLGQWEADGGALWDLSSNEYAGHGTTASWLPLLPGVVGVDEANAGDIDHVLLATTAPEYISTTSVWPARDSDGRSNAGDAIPMGSWLRLRSDADLSDLGPQALAIAEALQRYGVVLADSGGTHTLSIRGTADGRWDREDLRTLGELSVDDFEVVDPSSIMVAPDSMAVRAPSGG